MVFCVDIAEDMCVNFLADEMKIISNEEGANLAEFYRVVFDTTTKDKNGHIYATYGNKLVAAYYLDSVIGIRQLVGISDAEFEEASRSNALEELNLIKRDTDDGGDDVLIEV